MIPTPELLAALDDAVKIFEGFWNISQSDLDKLDLIRKGIQERDEELNGKQKAWENRK